MHPSFHHVYVPPWAVPVAPPQQTVRAFREAGTQTSTGAIQARPHASHTAEDVADHFQVRLGALVSFLVCSGDVALQLVLCLGHSG